MQSKRRCISPMLGGSVCIKEPDQRGPCRTQSCHHPAPFAEPVIEPEAADYKIRALCGDPVNNIGCPVGAVADNDQFPVKPGDSVEQVERSGALRCMRG